MPSLKRPDIDKHLGARIRLARRSLLPAMSQTALAEHLGCTFQQVQKYEGGKDRLAASTLLTVAEITGHPVGWFFTDEPFETAREAA